jgi:hypothetical protein
MDIAQLLSQGIIVNACSYPRAGSKLYAEGLIRVDRSLASRVQDSLLMTNRSAPPSSMRVELLLLSGAAVCLMLAQPGSGGSSPGTPERQTRHAEAGRVVFNGKGACFYCHGIDGRREKLPRIEADTAALIARLDPAPADLRNPKTLRLKSDRERMNAIREGHPGTGMFPDTSITDDELADTLAFLELLRREGAAKPK